MNWVLEGLCLSQPEKGETVMDQLLLPPMFSPGMAVLLGIILIVNIVIHLYNFKKRSALKALDEESKDRMLNFSEGSMAIVCAAMFSMVTHNLGWDMGHWHHFAGWAIIFAHSWQLAMCFVRAKKVYGL